MNNKKGFTIIELIVVVAIIAVLAAVVIVSVGQYIVKSKKTALKAEAAELQIAILKYVAEHGSIGVKDPDTGIITSAFWGGSDGIVDPEYAKITNAIINQGYTYGKYDSLQSGTSDGLPRPNGWAIIINFYYYGEPFYCIDYLGHKQEINTESIIDFDCTKPT